MTTKRIFHFRTDRDGRWEQCVLEFLATKDKASTGDQLVQVWRSILRNFFSDPTKRPDQMSRQDVEAFLQRPGRHGAPSFNTVNNRLICLRSFYKFASERTIGSRPLLKTNPVEGIKLAKGSQIDRDIDEEHVDLFFAQIDRSTIIGKRDRALFMMYLLTARRRAEVCRLLWGDLEQVATATGPAWFYCWKGKGHRSKDSQAEMPPKALQAIEEYLRADGRWGKMAPDDAIFIAHRHHDEPKTAINKYTVNKRFRLYADRAGLPGVAVVHSFRHLSAWLRYQENGHDILATARDLGHTGTDTIIRYIKRREAKYRRDETVRALERRFAFL